MSLIPVVPAIIPKTLSEVIAFAKTLNFSHELHLDVVDGKFVESISWPYEPMGEPVAAKPHTDAYTLEVDLMVLNPKQAALEWVRAGADMLVFHLETIDVFDFQNITNDLRQVSFGISFSGDTPAEAVLPYLPYADYVQLMGIKKIGSQGQPFDEAVFEKIEFIKSKAPELLISVDGSVNQETAKSLIKAGVDRLIVGSAIAKANDPKIAYQNLISLINEN